MAFVGNQSRDEIAFFWERNRKGYDLIRSRDDFILGGDFIGYEPQKANYEDWNVLSPSDRSEKQFLNHFADLDGTARSFRSFSNRYGLLKKPVSIEQYIDTDGDNLLTSIASIDTGFVGVPLSLYIEEHYLLKRVRELFHWISIQKHEQINTLFSWEKLDTEGREIGVFWGNIGAIFLRISDGGKYKFVLFETKKVILEERRITNQESFAKYHVGESTDLYEEEIEFGDHLRIAKRFLVEILNRKLAEYTPTIRHLRFDRRLLVPSSLIGAIWVLMSDWVAGERGFAKCSFCGEWDDIDNFDSFLQDRQGNYFHKKCKANYREREKRLSRRIREILTNNKTPISSNQIFNYLNEGKSRINKWKLDITPEFIDQRLEALALKSESRIVKTIDSLWTVR